MRRLSTFSTVSSTTTLPGYTLEGSHAPERRSQLLPTYACLYPPPRSQSILDGPSTWHSFAFELKKNSNHAPWATLNLMSHAATSDATPLLYSGNVLKGFVNLAVHEPMMIRDISLILRGIIFMTTSTVGASFEHTFFESTITSPHPPAFGKLSGSIDWPFETTLPTSVLEKDDTGVSREYPLPEFFYEKKTSVQVVYELTARIQRGRYQSDAVLTKNGLFTPRVTPPPFSRLRQASYLENRALPGPDVDPEGWVSIPFRCAGRSKDGSGIMINGTVSITRPLIYTRGSVISCHVAIEGASRLDIKDLLDVHLRRRVTFLDPAVGRKRQLKKCTETFETNLPGIQWHTVRQLDGILSGEIHVHKELSVSSTYPMFFVQYSIIVSPKKPTAGKFVPIDPQTPLAVQPIDVVSDFALEGPLPKPLTRPPHPSWLDGPNPLVHYQSSLSYSDRCGGHGVEIAPNMVPARQGYASEEFRGVKLQL